MNFEHDGTIEKAIRMICVYTPKDWNRPKRLLMHDMRVGFYLYEHGYNTDVIIAGFLHDILEWSACDEQEIRETCGERALEIIKANTKDRTIEDPGERREEYIQRCARVGEDALIVKSVDALDSYAFYNSMNNKIEVERAQDIMKKILAHKTENMNDRIFDEIKKCV